MDTTVKAKELDIISIHEQVDEIIFNNIDTAANYQDAYKVLAQKLDEVLQFLKRYLQANKLDVPPSNTYWTLFAGLVSKLMYFKAYTMWKLDHGKVEEMKDLFIASACVLPNKETEAAEEILEDISANYDVFQKEKQLTPVVNLHDDVLEKKLTTTQCLTHIAQKLL